MEENKPWAGMTVREYVAELLKLNQDLLVVICDSEYPADLAEGPVPHALKSWDARHLMVSWPAARLDPSGQQVIRLA